MKRHALSTQLFFLFQRVDLPMYAEYHRVVPIAKRLAALRGRLKELASRR